MAQWLLHLGFYFGAIVGGFHLFALAHGLAVATVGTRHVVHAAAIGGLVGGAAGTGHVGWVAGLGTGRGTGSYGLGKGGAGSESQGGGEDEGSFHGIGKGNGE